jgi:hypothetical protein
MASCLLRSLPAKHTYMRVTRVRLQGEHVPHVCCLRPKNSLLTAAFVNGVDQPAPVFQLFPPKFENKNPTAAPDEGRHASANDNTQLTNANRALVGENRIKGNVEHANATGDTDAARRK